eukprot:2743350-Prymnesium_polylepis.1
MSWRVSDTWDIHFRFPIASLPACLFAADGRPPSAFVIQTCEFCGGVSNKRCSHQEGHILASF